tara:strand:+ start:4149 stop:5561 length:1413 start_codon:yes stop_codon:yes gene_type:complete
MYNSKAYPYPQIVTGEDWNVFENTEHDPQPRTDNLNRQMYVPMDRECEDCGVNHSRMIRRHELGHAKWSPKTMGKLMRGTRADCIHALEEVRINYLLAARAKLPCDEPVLCMDKVQATILRMIKSASVADIILYILASKTYTNDNYVLEAVISRDVVNAFHEASDDETLHIIRQSELKFAIQVANSYAAKLINHRYNQWPSYRKVQKLAEKLSHVINEFIDKPKADEIHAPKPQPGESEHEAEGEGDEAIAAAGNADELEKRMRTSLQEDMLYRSGSGIGQWGQMEIHEPPMSVNLRSRINHGRAYRPMDYGYNPKYINRYCIDKKIFKQKQRVKGGTILIDASGSMNFYGKDILDIMMLLPAVNIAMYNGYHNGGNLRIIAKNGMRVDDTYLDEHSGGGNVIDGPALRWLAEMPPRRIWVSDMKVFGIGRNSNGYNLLKDCYDICTANRIINLKDIDEVKEHALKLNVV